MGPTNERKIVDYGDRREKRNRCKIIKYIPNTAIFLTLVVVVMLLVSQLCCHSLHSTPQQCLVLGVTAPQHDTSNHRYCTGHTQAGEMR